MSFFRAAALTATLATFTAHAQAPVSLGDLNTADTVSGQVNAPTAWSGALYFGARGAEGSELWKSDGTTAGTALLKDLNPGPTGSSPGQFLATGSALYFTANDGGGRGLWKTDGTAGGTVKLLAVNTSGNPDLELLATVGNLLLFAVDDGVVGRELWVSDGTPSGTVLVEDINPAGASITTTGTPMPRGVVFGGKYYFGANDGTSGNELWVSDGTAGGTQLVKDLRAGDHALPGSFLLAGTRFFFSAIGATEGRELWVSDGTSSGTQLVSDIRPGAQGSVYQLAGVALGNDIVFAADDGTSGLEQWKSDGTAGGTQLVLDIEPGANPSMPQGMVAVGGKAWFCARTASTGAELWRSDGTASGTALVRELLPGTGAGCAPSLRGLGTQVLFRGDTGAGGTQLFSSDGTVNGTALVVAINAAGNSDPQLSTGAVFNGAVYFAADDGIHAEELWKTDGTAQGTSLVMNIGTGLAASNPNRFARAGNRDLFFADQPGGRTNLFFTDATAQSATPVTGLHLGARMFATEYAWTGSQLAWAGAELGSPAQELWCGDGLDAGSARQVSELAPGAAQSSLDSLRAWGQRVLFRGRATLSGSDELWVSDCTDAGTVQLTALVADGGGVVEQLPLPDGGMLFTAYTPALGLELWRTDGTAAGTSLLVDLDPAPGRGNVQPVVPFQGAHLIRAQGDADAGAELWWTDGTAAGTRLVKDLDPTPGVGGEPGSPAVASAGRAWFYAFDSAAGFELWQTDGTSAGTRRLTDAPSGNLDLEFLDGPAGDRAVFAIQTGSLSYEVYATGAPDGGTTLLASGLASVSQNESAVINGRVYFAADDGDAGLELWESDGTPSGTRLAADLRPGPASSSPSRLTAVGEVLYFGAFQDGIGPEPVAWSFDTTPPTITPVLSGTPGSNGWYTSAVGVSWLVRDDGSPHTLCPAVATVAADTSDAGFSCTAQSRGGSATATVLVKLDSAAPALTCPANQTVTADSTLGATVTWAVTAPDALDPAPVVTASVDAGSVLPVGTASITVQATDHAGNAATCAFTVTVNAAGAGGGAGGGGGTGGSAGGGGDGPPAGCGCGAAGASPLLALGALALLLTRRRRQRRLGPRATGPDDARCRLGAV